MTTYLTISAFMNFAAGLLLAFAVMLRERRSELHRRFGLFTLSVGAWSAAYVMWQLSGDRDRALFFARLLMLPAYFVPVLYLHFVVLLCGETARLRLRLAYGCAVGFTCLDFTPLMVTTVVKQMEFPFWPQAGPLFIAYLLLFAACTVQAVMLMLGQLRVSAGARASQLRYILVATLVGFPGGATNFPLWYGVQVPPVGNALIFLYLVIMAHAISRYQLPLAAYDFVHAAVYLGVAATLAVFFLLVQMVAASLEGIPPAMGELLNSFLLAMLVSLFFLWAVPRLKAGADRIVEQTYLRRRRSLNDRLKHLARQICTISAEDEIFETTAREIAVAMDVVSLGLFVRPEFGDRHDLRAQAGWDSDGFTLRAIPADSVLALVLTRLQAPLLLDGSEAELPPADLAGLGRLRSALPFEAAFPILTEGVLLGLLVLGPRGNRDPYTDRDLSLLEAICLQIAVTLRARQLERRANQAEKLISLGTLAAGLAHELRNPLVSIRTFSALMAEQGGDAEFRREFRAVVERDVQRIGAIIEHVAAFAENSPVKFTLVSLNEVVQAVYDISRPEFVRGGVAFVPPAPGLPAVLGNYGQLLQVFLNLFQNAIHALQGRPDARIEVSAQVLGAVGGGRALVLAISDNGPGIAAELRDRIFEPFVTTKATGDGQAAQRGMGLGLAIAKRIIEGHRGAISVTSGPAGGTTFLVHLPCPS